MIVKCISGSRIVAVRFLLKIWTNLPKNDSREIGYRTRRKSHAHRRSFIPCPQPFSAQYTRPTQTCGGCIVHRCACARRECTNYGRRTQRACASQGLILPCSIGSEPKREQRCAVETLAAVYTTTVGGQQYTGDIEQSGAEYTASVANLPGVSASGSSVIDAEINLSIRIDEIV